MRLLIPQVLMLLLLPFAHAWSADGRQAVNARLFDELRRAPTESAGRAAEDAIWEMWLAEGPSEEIRGQVKAAMKARDAYNFDGAMALLDKVVVAAPDYAEGWNQRAFVHFLKDELDQSLADLDRAIELEPRHFGALAGKAIILMRQGRAELGQKALRAAVAIHPWLKERSMLIPAPGTKMPAPRGRDI